jgi:hypothetical protein
MTPEHRPVTAVAHPIYNAAFASEIDVLIRVCRVVFVRNAHAVPSDTSDVGDQLLVEAVFGLRKVERADLRRCAGMSLEAMPERALSRRL